MKRLSQIFRPAMAVPKDAKLKPQERTCNSQRLLSELGLVRSTTTGCFALLPLAARSLHKLESSVRRALESVGAQRVTLPSLAPRELWRRSGRLQEMEQELFTLSDRHQRSYVLSPTHEEVITELLAETAPISHKQLPFMLYQMSNKYRDERRPRHGLLRAREFPMCDAYSFHGSDACARQTYARVTHAYTHLLSQLRVPFYRVEADNGTMGGSESHEYHYVAAAGEDTLLTCERCARRCTRQEERLKCLGCDGDKFTMQQSIEVAHTFILGTRYSSALSATFSSTPPQPIIMACYGIGVTRLLAAALEATSDDRLRWPNGIAPYTVVVIGPKEGSHEWKSGGAEAAKALALALDANAELTDDVLWDDRHQLTVGKRLMDADQMGYPLVVVIGRKGLELHTHTNTPKIFSTHDEIVHAVRQHAAAFHDDSSQDRSMLTA